MPIVIRLALANEAADLASLEALQPTAAGWGLEGFRTELIQPCSSVWSAWDGKFLLGFLALRYAGGLAEILNVAVRPQSVRSGIGMALLSRALTELHRSGAQQVTLEVERDNKPACALYTKAGLTVRGTRKNFYGLGRDAWIMGKDL